MYTGLTFSGLVLYHWS